MFKDIKILLVEDSPTQAQGLVYCLEENGFIVKWAKNGKEALDFFYEFNPHLLISDVVMPEMSGYDLCRAIKTDKNYKAVPVILLTSLSDTVDVMRGLECGADNFITKPVEEQYLLSRLNYMLANLHLSDIDYPKMGLEIAFSGQKYFITSDRLQILNLLLSTYESAVQKNNELVKTQEDLRLLNEELEERVKERTEELHESERRLRHVIDLVPHYIYARDRYGNIILCNEAAAKDLGFSLKEIIGKNIFEISFSKEEANKFLEIDNEIIEKQVKKVVPHDVFTDANGRKHVVHTIKMPFPFTGTDELGILGISVDVTDLYQTQQRLEMQYEVTRLIAESSSLELSAHTILKTICTSMEWSYGEFWEYNHERSLLEPIDFWTANDKEFSDFKKSSLDTTFARGEGLHGRAFLRNEPHWVEDLQLDPDFKRKALAEKAGLKSAFVIPINYKNIPKGVLLFLNKQTLTMDEEIFRMFKNLSNLIGQFIERCQTEQLLKESQSLYSSLVEHIPLNIFRKNKDGVYTFGNRNYLNILGISHEMLCSKTDYDFFPKELAEKYRNDDWQVMKNNQTVEYEEEFKTPTGQTRYIHTVKTPLKNIHKETIGIQGIFWDVTEQKNLEHQLRQSQKMEAVGQLAGGVAHDFNNLLMVIRSYSEFSLETLGSSHPVSSDLNEVIKAADRASSLTRQLLAFSRKQVMQPKVLNINELIQNLEKMLVRLIGEDIQMVSFLSEEIGYVKIDPGQFEQVVLNLVVNARDAMSDGGKITVETRNITLDEEYARKHLDIKPGSYVMLQVSDTGCGMDEKMLAHIFEPFFTTKETGTGLGLATVFGIVKQSGGDILVYSEVNKGTTFKVYFPIEDVQSKISIQDITEGKDLSGDETVLVVEDEPMVRKAIVRMLTGSGYTVLEATSGQEALLLASEHKDRVQLLISDMILPEMNGIEIKKQVLQLIPQIKTLFMSGYADRAVFHNGMLDQDESFIQKPILAKDLLSKVRSVLDNPK